MADGRRPVARGRRTRLGAVTALTLAAGGLLAGCGSTAEGDGAVTGLVVHDSDGMNGAVLTSPYRLADGSLTDTEGARVHLRRALDAPLTLVFFGYTNCPDICQAVMADLASARARLDPADEDRVATWFVTTDPARDDPQTLRTYLDRFDPSFEGFTGPLEDVVGIARSVHVLVEKGRKLPSGGYEVVHSTPVLGVRPDGSVPIVWTAGTSAAKIAADVHTLVTTGLPSGSPTPDEG